MSKDLILYYFDVLYYKKSGIPKIKLIFKPEFKKDKNCPVRKDGYPYSGVQKEYYIHYLGEELGNLVFKQRVKLCSKQKLIDWYLENFSGESQCLVQEKERISKKLSSSLKTHYSSPEGEKTKKKLRERQDKWAKIVGEKISEKWKNDSQWKKDEMERRKNSGFYEKVAEKNRKRMIDPEYREKFLKICNSPERIKKISESAKSMWNEAREKDKDKFYRMILSHKRKNFSINGYEMNSIEYQIAKILNELKISWEYERILHLKNKSYCPDFTLSRNKIIECFGDFWHANPEYFGPKQKTHKTKLAEDVWKYDNEKLENLRKNGYKILVLWEKDIREDLEKCKQLIKQFYE